MPTEDLDVNAEFEKVIASLNETYRVSLNAISEARRLLGTLLLEDRAPRQEEYESVDRQLVESFQALQK